MSDSAKSRGEKHRRLTTVAALFVIAYAMANFTDRRLSAVFSQFWHKAQQKLREALKRARTEMLRAGSGKS